MPPPFRSRPSRRQLLGSAAGLAVSAATGVAATAGCAAPSSVAAGKTRMRYWHLFGGGDGVNMQAMLDDFGKEHSGIDVDAAQLEWGAPYYTKLGMAGAGGRAPEVAVLHISRLAGFGPGQLLDAFDLDLIAEYGVTPDDFPAEICEQAGLPDGDGKLKPIGGVDEFLDALREIKKVTKRPALVAETPGPTPWAPGGCSPPATRRRVALCWTPPAPGSRSMTTRPCAYWGSS